MPDLVLLAGLSEDTGDVAAAVVGHDALDLDALTTVPAESATKEGDGCLRPFVGQELDVGQAAVIIDADVGELPASAIRAAAPVAGDAVSNPPEAPEFLGVEVEELARTVSLVSDHRGLRL
jgi:hypothetical protein